MTTPFNYTLLRENIYVQCYFEKPTFKWPEMTSRFFEMLSNSFFGTAFNLQTNELTTNASQNFSELRARYSVFGGTTAVSLLPDRLTFDLPGLSLSDLPTAREVMQTVHDEFIKTFSDVTLGRLEVQDFAHLELGSQDAVSNALKKYRLSELDFVFGDKVVATPSARFSIASNEGDWRAVAMLEPSQLKTTAVFGSIAVTLLKVSPTLLYLQKAALVQSITSQCLKTLHLVDAENAA